MRLGLQQNEGFQKNFRQAVVAALVFLLLLLPAQPARAACCIELTMANVLGWAAELASWAAKMANLESMLSSAEENLGDIGEYTDNFEKRWYDLNRNMIFGYQLKDADFTQQATNLATSMEDTTMGRVFSEVITSELPPPPSNQNLCHLTLAREPTVFTSSASATALHALFTNSPGKGPSFALDNVVDARCGNKAKGVFGFGSPKDGYDKIPGCYIDTTTTELSLQDADLNATTFDAVLEKPPMEKQNRVVNGVSTVGYVPKPDPAKRPQLFWMAAVNYCRNVAGGQVELPAGDKLTPNQAVAASEGRHCAALKSSYMGECVKQIERNMRLDCTNQSPSGLVVDSDIKAKCDADKKMCVHAKGAGVDFAGSGIDPNCTTGLTPRQRDFISQALCATDQYAISAIGAGTNFGVLMGQGDQCALFKTMQKLSEAEEESVFIAAMANVLEMDECWEGSETRNMTQDPTKKASANKQGGGNMMKKINYQGF